MGAKSRRKGQVGEREFADLLSSLGLISHRTGQEDGGLEADVQTLTLEGVHWEAKRAERLQLNAHFEQARKDMEPDDVPVVAHRMNRQEWRITLPAKDMIRFAERILYARNCRGLFDD